MSVYGNYLIESTKNKCKIFSCFAGVGKNYAIEKLTDLGYKVYSIEKYGDFYKIYPNTKVDYPKDIKAKAKKYDILFIPYFLDMDNRFLKGSNIDYTIIYPDKSLKNEYIKRFKTLGFTEEEISYLKDNFDDMITDIESSSCNKIKLNKNEYCLEKILEITQ